MLSTILGSETRARIVALLVADPHRGFHVRELVREVGTGTSGVQREIERLEGIGLVRSERGAGGRRVVRLVEGHPLITPLAGLVAAEAPAAYGIAVADDEAVGVNPHVAPLIAGIVEACKEAGVERATLFGSSTQPGRDIVPRDIDLMIRMRSGLQGDAEGYFALLERLRRLTGREVDLIDERAVRNPYLAAEIERTGVVIHETA